MRWKFQFPPPRQGANPLRQVRRMRWKISIPAPEGANHGIGDYSRAVEISIPAPRGGEQRFDLLNAKLVDFNSRPRGRTTA